jgi:hypothetical protein
VVSPVPVNPSSKVPFTVREERPAKLTVCIPVPGVATTNVPSRLAMKAAPEPPLSSALKSLNKLPDGAVMVKSSELFVLVKAPRSIAAEKPPASEPEVIGVSVIFPASEGAREVLKPLYMLPSIEHVVILLTRLCRFADVQLVAQIGDAARHTTPIVRRIFRIEYHLFSLNVVRAPATEPPAKRCVLSIQQDDPPETTFGGRLRKTSC